MIHRSTENFVNWIRARDARFGKETVAFTETVFTPIVIKGRVLLSKN
jgi:hypothetical protein